MSIEYAKHQYIYCIGVLTKYNTEMKQVTINQINSFLKRNDTIREYVKNAKDYADYRRNYKTTTRKFTLNGHTWQVSMNGTFIWNAACKYLKDYTGKSYTGDWSKTCDTDLHIYHKPKQHAYLSIYAYLNCTFEDGFFVRIESSFKPLDGLLYPVKSNSTPQEFNLEQYIRNVIMPKYMYSTGLLGYLQVKHNATKQEVPNLLKQYYLKEKAIPQIESDRDYIAYRSLRHRLKKKNNIIVHDTATPQELIPLLKQPKHKKHVNAYANPDIFSLYDQLSGEHDTDDGLLNAAQDMYSNAIFY